MSKTASLRYFGRAVPVLLRKFPLLTAKRLEPTVGASERTERVNNEVLKNTQCQAVGFKGFRWCRRPIETDSSHIDIPTGLSGKANMLIIGFQKKNMIREMFTWYSLGRTLYVELPKKRGTLIPQNVNDQKVLAEQLPFHCYTLFVLPRIYYVFHWWLRWRYKRLIRLYVVNRLKKQEANYLCWLASEAGVMRRPETLSQELKHASEQLALSVAQELEPEHDIWLLPDQELSDILKQKRQAKALKNLREARETTLLNESFVNTLYSHTLFCYTHRRKFLDNLQLPDAKRTYAAIVDVNGKISWFEDERCTVAKANDALSTYRLEDQKIPSSFLPKRTSVKTMLYHKCAYQALPLFVGNNQSAKSGGNDIPPKQLPDTNAPVRRQIQ